MARVASMSHRSGSESRHHSRHDGKRRREDSRSDTPPSKKHREDGGVRGSQGFVTHGNGNHDCYPHASIHLWDQLQQSINGRYLVQPQICKLSIVKFPFHSQWLSCILSVTATMSVIRTLPCTFWDQLRQSVNGRYFVKPEICQQLNLLASG